MTPAARSRRYHRRKRSGHIVLAVEVDAFGLADAMLEAGILDEASSRDRRKLANAAAQVLAAWVRKSATHSTRKP